MVDQHPLAPRYTRVFADRIIVDHDLTRRLVSYQGNKHIPGFRWMKYKEGFSAPLVERFLGLWRRQADPRAGSLFRYGDHCPHGQSGRP